MHEGIVRGYDRVGDLCGSGKLSVLDAHPHAVFEEHHLQFDRLPWRCIWHTIWEIPLKMTIDMAQVDSLPMSSGSSSCDESSDDESMTQPEVFKNGLFGEETDSEDEESEDEDEESEDEECEDEVEPMSESESEDACDDSLYETDASLPKAKRWANDDVLVIGKTTPEFKKVVTNNFLRNGTDGSNAFHVCLSCVKGHQGNCKECYAWMWRAHGSKPIPQAPPSRFDY